jgi:metallophosphoesterase (TIGR03767 family)
VGAIGPGERGRHDGHAGQEAAALISHLEFINEHFNTRGLPAGHGFTSQNVETDTGYYTFDPVRGIHCVVLDTVNPAGAASGNIDRKQFDWLDADLTAHAGDVTIVFSHHTIASLNNTQPRPNDPNPPLLGADLEQLLWAHPNVIALINGHMHQNAIFPHAHPTASGIGFWEINTAAHIDWPQQSRMIEIFDNLDGTLSIFGTIFDHMAAPDSPSLTTSGLATISRELCFNDPQIPPSFGSGTPMDRNVELIVRRPSA